MGLTVTYFFLLPSLAHSGLQNGSILWSPYKAIKEKTMKRNTQNLILCTGRVHPPNSHLGRTQLVILQVWFSVLHDGKASTQFTQTTHTYNTQTLHYTAPHQATHVLVNICSTHSLSSVLFIVNLSMDPLGAILYTLCLYKLVFSSSACQCCRVFMAHMWRITFLYVCVRVHYVTSYTLVPAYVVASPQNLHYICCNSSWAYWAMTTIKSWYLNTTVWYYRMWFLVEVRKKHCLCLNTEVDFKRQRWKIRKLFYRATFHVVKVVKNEAS